MICLNVNTPTPCADGMLSVPGNPRAKPTIERALRLVKPDRSPVANISIDEIRVLLKRLPDEYNATDRALPAGSSAASLWASKCAGTSAAD